MNRDENIVKYFGYHTVTTKSVTTGGTLYFLGIGHQWRLRLGGSRNMSGWDGLATPGPEASAPEDSVGPAMGREGDIALWTRAIGVAVAASDRFARVI